MARRIIRKPELFSKIGLSDASIWRREKVGDFPKRVRLGGNSVGWFEDEIDAWQEEKASDRQPARGPIRREEQSNELPTED